MKHLIFRLYAPLVSWGEIAVGGERHSALHPSKSAVTGLLAAALGISREEEEKHTELAEGIGIGIKLISGGSILNDYHTTQVSRLQKKVLYHSRKDEMVLGDSIDTILSNREYRTDSLSIVAVWQQKTLSVTLEEMREALLKPVYHLYLGRKSCPPALPLEPRIDAQSENLKRSLDSAAFGPLFFDEDPEKVERMERKIFGSGKTMYFWEEHPDPGLKSLQKTERYDQTLSRKRWQFSGRTEYMGFEQKEDV